MNCDEYNAETKKRKAENYKNSMRLFEQAKKLAEANGFELNKRSPWHFSLKYKVRGYTKWLWSLYPSNQRIYTDPHYRGPFLKLTKPWTLLDVVCAAMREAKAELIGVN